jgi:hypothetical protein
VSRGEQAATANGLASKGLAGALARRAELRERIQAECGFTQLAHVHEGTKMGRPFNGRRYEVAQPWDPTADPRSRRRERHP